MRTAAGMGDKLRPTRALLRWHGGKWILGAWIIKHFPPHRVYTEVYGGAGSVLLQKPKSYAEVWNDLDGEVVNLFRVLRDKKGSAELRRLLFLTPFSRAEFKGAYQLTDDPVEKARRLVVRSYMGFGSDANNLAVSASFRSNSNRAGTTPSHDWANYPGALSRTIRRLRGVVLENRDALKVLLQHDGPDTLHYVDPPYVHATRGQGSTDFRHRYAHEMFDHDHRDLARILNGLQGMVVLSGYGGDLYDKLYTGWRTYQREAFADGARKRTEVLWLNEQAVENLNKKGKFVNGKAKK